VEDASTSSFNQRTAPESTSVVSLRPGREAKEAAACRDPVIGLLYLLCTALSFEEDCPHVPCCTSSPAAAVYTTEKGLVAEKIL